MDATFKPAEASDIDRLLMCMQEFYEIDNHQFNATVACNALKKLLSDESLGRIWLIHYQGEAIGYVVLTLGYSLEYQGRDAFIDELYIRAEYQGQGFGKQTLKFVEDAARSLGINALHLEVERENTSAQSFYRGVGFKDQNRYLMTKWILSS